MKNCQLYNFETLKCFVFRSDGVLVVLGRHLSLVRIAYSGFIPLCWPARFRSDVGVMLGKVVRRLVEVILLR